MSGTPFQINVSEEALVDLRQRLALTRFPDELDESGWDYGVPLADIKRLVKYWKDDFDWKAKEKALNAIPQFTMDVDVEGHGKLNVHFIHQRSSIVGAIPLLFIHGWPGSFLEVTKILPLLTAASADRPSFHVVAISLPGYTFSEAPKKKGFDINKHAEVAHKLMLSLGYNEYVAQGGDWGSFISTFLGKKYGERNCKAIHLNMAAARAPEGVDASSYTKQELVDLQRTQEFQKNGMGYYHEQSTKPQTLAYSLADSPAGLLAWIYEKLVTWTDAYPWTDDEVLTWISLYWFSRAGPAASIRIYYEFVHITGDIFSQRMVKVPIGVSTFPKDLAIIPKSWYPSIGNVVFEKRHTSGGHFAAFEVPEKLADDLVAMFGKGGPAYGVVEGWFYEVHPFCYVVDDKSSKIYGPSQSEVWLPLKLYE